MNNSIIDNGKVIQQWRRCLHCLSKKNCECECEDGWIKTNLIYYNPDSNIWCRACNGTGRVRQIDEYLKYRLGPWSECVMCNGLGWR